MRARFINEELSPEEKREEVMKILNNRNIQVPHDSYVKFFDLSLTDLTPEEIVDRLLNENLIKGGKGDKLTAKDVCPKQLAIGKEVEKEHTTSKKKATEIALDHLAEDPKYYSKHVESGLVDEKPAIDLYVKYFGKDKLPKKLQENQEFERGKDPKQAMGIGHPPPKEYIVRQLKSQYPDEEGVEDMFWESFANGMRDMSMEEIIDELLTTLENTPIEYQKKYIDDHLEGFKINVMDYQ